MDQEPDVIRQNIEETRSSLTEKIESLEQEVIGTVKGATSAVSETVENVKETVNETVENVKDTLNETVESVKETFDVRLQVCRHPWAMVGGAAAAGFLAGSLLPSSRRTDFGSLGAPSLSSLSAGPPARHYDEEPTYRPVAQSSPQSAERPAAGPSFFASLLNSLGPEIDKVKGLAIGAAAGVVRDLIKGNLPAQLAPRVEELMNDVTTKLGGQPVRGPLLDTASWGQSSGQAESYPGGVCRR